MLVQARENATRGRGELMEGGEPRRTLRPAGPVVRLRGVSVQHARMVRGMAGQARVIANAVRLLKPGGRFVLHVHNRYFRTVWVGAWCGGSTYARCCARRRRRDHAAGLRRHADAPPLHPPRRRWDCSRGSMWSRCARSGGWRAGAGVRVSVARGEAGLTGDCRLRGFSVAQCEAASDNATFAPRTGSPPPPRPATRPTGRTRFVGCRSRP